MHWIGSKNSPGRWEEGTGRNRRECICKGGVTLNPSNCSQSGWRCFKEAAPQGTVVGVGRHHCQKTGQQYPVYLQSHFHFFFLSSSCKHNKGVWTSHFFKFLTSKRQNHFILLDFSLMCKVLSSFSGARLEGKLGITWSSLSPATKSSLCSFWDRSLTSHLWLKYRHREVQLR